MEGIAAALADGTAEARALAYESIEEAMRTASGGSSGGAAQAALVACVRPLVVSVLCSPASRVGEAEYRRAALLLYEMAKAPSSAEMMVAVVAEGYRRDDDGRGLFHATWTAPDTVFAAFVTKDPSAWTRDDAIIAAANHAVFGAAWSPGYAAVSAEAGWEEMEFLGDFMGNCPWMNGKYGPSERYTRLALLCLDIVRSEADAQPEGIVAGAAGLLGWLAAGCPPVGKAIFEAGFVDVLQATMQRFNPMERIGRQNLVMTMTFVAAGHVSDEAEKAGVDIIGPLLGAGAVDIAISSLQAYQMLNDPAGCSVCSVVWGVLYFLEILLRAEDQQAQLVIAKLRSAGVDAFRYLLDHPLVNFATFQGSGSQATRIAAQVLHIPARLPSQLLSPCTSHRLTPFHDCVATGLG